ncbi:MAG TPA: MFS transporter [Gammaproteobacteria bacterium]|nr:MFS transporter [Gammaproteobacteria bacterium]
MAATSQAQEPVGANQSALRTTALAMFALLLVAYTLMAADRYLISMLGTDIRGALNLSLPQMGTLTTTFTLGIAIAGLPSGALIARTSRRTVLLLGIVLFSVATLLFTQATGFASMFVLIVMQGAGMSFLATSMFALSASYFSKTRVAALGIVNVCFGLGSFLGPWAIGNIRSNTGAWQPPMLVFGLTGVGLAILCALLVRSWFTETKRAAEHGEHAGGADSLMNRNTLIFSVLSVLYGLTVYGWLGLYPTFLRDVLSLTPAEVGGVMPFFGLGSLTAFFAGQLGDRFPTKVILSSSSLVLVVLGFFLYLPGLSIATYKIMALLVGIFGAAIVYTNLAGGHIKALRGNLANKGSSMFVSSMYAGGAFGGLMMGSMVASWGWQIAGQIQVSLLSLLAVLLTFALRPAEFSK